MPRKLPLNLKEIELKLENGGTEFHYKDIRRILDDLTISTRALQKIKILSDSKDSSVIGMAQDLQAIRGITNNALETI